MKTLYFASLHRFYPTTLNPLGDYHYIEYFIAPRRTKVKTVKSLKEVIEIITNSGFEQGVIDNGITVFLPDSVVYK